MKRNSIKASNAQAILEPFMKRKRFQKILGENYFEEKTFLQSVKLSKFIRYSQ